VVSGEDDDLNSGVLSPISSSQAASKLIDLWCLVCNIPTILFVDDAVFFLPVSAVVIINL